MWCDVNFASSTILSPDVIYCWWWVWHKFFIVTKERYSHCICGVLLCKQRPINVELLPSHSILPALIISVTCICQRAQHSSNIFSLEGHLQKIWRKKKHFKLLLQRTVQRKCRKKPANCRKQISSIAGTDQGGTPTPRASTNSFIAVKKKLVSRGQNQIFFVLIINTLFPTSSCVYFLKMIFTVTGFASLIASMTFHPFIHLGCDTQNGNISTHDKIIKT